LFLAHLRLVLKYWVQPNAAMERLPTGFFRCEEDSNHMPKPLIGENDVANRPATEEIRCKTLGTEYKTDGQRVRLTTHRILWNTAIGEWIGLRLDEFASAKVEKSHFFTNPHIELQNVLDSGVCVQIKFDDKATTTEVAEQLEAAIKAERWKNGTYDAAAGGGFARLKRDQQAQIQATGEELNLALTDLGALREHAKQTVAAVRKIAATHASSDEGKVENSGSIGGLLEEFGLLQEDGSAVTFSGGTLPADIQADVTKVCQVALEKRGCLGMLQAHDVFCLVNRARGTSMVSAEEVMAALRQASSPGGLLRLRKLGSTSAYAVSLASASDAEADRQLLSAAEGGPLSAFRLATELKLNTAEAQYLLRDAEVRAVLVRDDAPDDVFYYKNFFSEY
jgi:hypothetical protein